MPELRGLTRHTNILGLMLDTDGFMARVFDRGDVVRARFGGDWVILTRSPELIEEVLVTHGRSFRKDRLTRDVAELLGNGLLVSDGEFWRRQRRLALPPHRSRPSPPPHCIGSACTRQVGRLTRARPLSHTLASARQKRALDPQV